jgi:hypothetical protein
VATSRTFQGVAVHTCATVFVAPLRHILCIGADTPMFLFRCDSMELLLLGPTSHRFKEAEA